jgi:uridine phosphorylase
MQNTYLPEATRWLTGATARFRARREFPAVAHFEVARAIVADATAESRTIAALAHKAETYDREAASFIERSAEADHEASERAAVPQ